MLSKNTQRLLSAVIVGMSISSLPMFSLAASAATSESSNAETADTSNYNVKNNSEQGVQTATSSETKKDAALPVRSMDKTPMDPTKVFDNLYYVGTKNVGVWVLNTSDGIILIDSMNNSEEAENIIIPGIKKLGFDPANIKYVLITHGHGDHCGGAKYIEDNYGATVLASAVDWDLMTKSYEQRVEYEAAGKDVSKLYLCPPIPKVTQTLQMVKS